MWNKIEETTFADIYFFDASSFIFKESHILMEEDNPLEKIAIIKEEPAGIDRWHWKLSWFTKTSVHQWEILQS